MNAAEAVRNNDKEEELHNELAELTDDQNKSRDATLIPATFMGGHSFQGKEISNVDLATRSLVLPFP